MEKDIRSSSGQDRRHLKQQRSKVKDPFRAWQLLGHVIRWFEAFGSRTLHGGESAFWCEKASALCVITLLALKLSELMPYTCTCIRMLQMFTFPIYEAVSFFFQGSKCKQRWEKRLFRCLNLVAWSLAEFWTPCTTDDDDVIRWLPSRERPQRCATLLWNRVRLHLLLMVNSEINLLSKITIQSSTLKWRMLKQLRNFSVSI